MSIVHWIILSTVASYVMQKTAFGNWVYATGGDAQAARLAGVPVARVKIILYVCTALAAALSATNETLTFQNGNITLGSQYVFTGIAGAVIGGVLLTGGYGSPVGTVFGSLTYGIVSLGVFFLGWNADLGQFLHRPAAAAGGAGQSRLAPTGDGEGLTWRRRWSNCATSPSITSA